MGTYTNKVTHIIGGGISGLGSAYFLKKKNAPSIVLEESDRVGGKAGFREDNGKILEIGGKNFSSSWTLFNQILNDFSIQEFDVQHPNFHILLRDKLMCFSKKIKISEMLPMVEGIGVKGLFQFLRFLRYMKRNRNILNYSSGLIEEIENKYDSQPLSSHFDKRLAYGPFRMFTIIMGGAEPEEMFYSNLSLLLSGFGSGSHHSITGGIIKLFNKLKEVPEDIQLNTKVDKIHIKNMKVEGLSISTNNVKGFISSNQVISAVPLHILQRLIDFPSDIKQEIKKIRYYPVALINAEYENDVFDQECNSIMFDQKYHLGHCSANRLYQKNRIRFTVAGKKGRTVLNNTDEQLIALAEKEFSAIRPISSQRVSYDVQRHVDGICAYSPYFTKIKRTILDYIASINGLEIAGDYLEGHCMEECLTSAKKAVETLLDA